MRRFVGAVLVALLIGLAAACSGLGSVPKPVQSPGSPTRASSAAPKSNLVAYQDWRPLTKVTFAHLTGAERMDLRTKFLKGLAKSDDLTNPKPVALVRWVPEAQIGKVLAACFTQAGFPAQAGAEEGTVTYDSGVPASQQAAYDRVEYTCNSEYSLDPKYGLNENASQLAATYEYDTTWMLPCFAEQHYPAPTSKPPTKARFVATFYTDPKHRWDPWDEVYQDEATSHLSAAQALVTLCPSDPPDAAIFG